MGVSLVRRGGNYYAVKDFAASVAELGPEQVEQKIGQLLQQRGLQPAGMSQDARQTCERGRGVETPVHHALGGDGFIPATGCPGTENFNRAVP